MFQVNHLSDVQPILQLNYTCLHIQQNIYNEILYQKSKNRSDTLKTINFNDIKDYLKGGKFEQNSNSNNAQSIL